MMKQEKDYFSSLAANYAQFRPTYPMELVEFLSLQTRGHDCAWDAGCGSGQLSILLAQRFARVLATDVSEEQLRHAVAHPAVEYLHASAEHMEFGAGSVDLAVSSQAAHWFDLPAYYTQVRRVIKPGGLLALICYHLIRGEADITGIIHYLYGTVLNSYWPLGREAVDTGYRDIYFPFQDIKVPALSIEVSWNRQQLFGYLLSWSAAKRYEEAGQGSIHRWLMQHLAPCWPDELAVKSFYFPIHMRAARLD